ncbi:MAG: ROK family protein [Victivallaceae bacterium]|nr:ROK family protein [Victivallaceae bacterium]
MNNQSGILQLNSIKKNNRQALLRELYLGGPMSRVELSRRLNCNGTTTTRGIRNLMECGLVLEGQLEKIQQGRPRRILKFNSAKMKSIGIEISPGKIVAIIADLSGKILLRDQVRFSVDIESDELMACLDEVTDRLLAEVPKDERLGVGVATFGHFHHDSRIIEKAAGFHAIEHTDIEKHFIKKFNIKPEIIDGTLALAYNQTQTRQSGQGICVTLNLGRGIGHVVTINGKAVSTRDSHPGEFGHTSCEINGLLCSCGRRGCLETVSSIGALLKKVSEEYRPMEFDELCSTWHKNPVLTDIVNYAATYLAAGIANLINITVPDKLILCGELLKLGDQFTDKLKEQLKEYAIQQLIEYLDISIPKFDSYSISLGATSPLIRKFFE